jgi:hypothetical protein
MALDSWARTKNFDPVGCVAQLEIPPLNPSSFQNEISDQDSVNWEFLSNTIDSGSEVSDGEPHIFPRDFSFLSNGGWRNFLPPIYSADSFSSDAYSDPGLLWEGNNISIYPQPNPESSSSSSSSFESSSDSESSFSDSQAASTALTVFPPTLNRYANTPSGPSLSAWICNGSIPVDPRINNMSYTAKGATSLAFVQGSGDSFTRARTKDEHWFVVDSGSNRHICADERFIHRGEIISASITGIGEASLSATAHGPMLGKITDVKGRLHDILSWCMFVPTSRMSLFSVVQAVLAGNTVIHEGDPQRGKHGLFLRDKGTFIPFTWCPEAGLFWLPMKCVTASPPVALQSTNL